jgi:hypothetical protein
MENPSKRPGVPEDAQDNMEVMRVDTKSEVK